jgi:hypothetical protein|tara:strand:- start:2605 stop:3162 length:558 start_codon:yes stop_codon:yes gene_type:complete
MKFKQLLSKIDTLHENAPEHTFGGGLYIGDAGRGSLSALSDKGTFNIKLPHSIDAINAMLSAFSSKDYIDPEGVLAVVKLKLNHFGFDFDAKNCKKAENQDGVTNFPLVQYGSPQLGVYGQNPYDDVNKKGFNQGDGITEKLGHGLQLSVSVQKNPNGLRRVFLVIAPSEPNQEVGGSTDCGCMH